MANYSFHEIKAAYAQKKDWEKQFPINYYFIRPLSFYLTYLILKVTQNPANVAIFGFALGLTGCLLLAGSSMWSIWPGLIFVLLYSISDAVDGNVARTTQNVTLFGKYLDGLLGNIIDGSYFFFLGIGLYVSGTGLKDPVLSVWFQDHARALPLFLGPFILICKLWAILFQARYETYRIRKEGSHPLRDSEARKVISKSTISDRWHYLLLVNLDSLNNQLLLLTIFSAVGLTIWFLVVFACFFFVKAIVYFVVFFEKTKSKLSSNVLSTNNGSQ
jgi:phosphatidylglycerophosphate synthase